MKEIHPVETPNQNEYHGEYHGNRFTETIVESNFNGIFSYRIIIL